jgi:hypothetical protein
VLPSVEDGALGLFCLTAFRKPHRYGLLTSLEVEEPLVRVDEPMAMGPPDETVAHPASWAAGLEALYNAFR